jgi:hypothetical protein
MTTLSALQATLAERLAAGNPAPVEATIQLKPKAVRVIAVNAGSGELRVKWPDGTNEVLLLDEIAGIEGA